MARGRKSKDRGGSQRKKKDPAVIQFERGREMVRDNLVFQSLLTRASAWPGNDCPPDGITAVFSDGRILCHPTRLIPANQWAWSIAHALLHLALGHHEEQRANPLIWNIACCSVVNRLLVEFGVGTRPDIVSNLDLGGSDEDAIYRRLDAHGIPPEALHLSPSGDARDLIGATAVATSSSYSHWHRPPKTWSDLFATGLRNALIDVVEMAAGTSVADAEKTPAARARRWFVDNYPLLGALAASFTLIEEVDVCQGLDIQVAAVCAESREIYINPTANLDTDELRFVMAHELLHVALRHQQRRQGRDPYLWNVACDYVINDWLIEMEVGLPPTIGVLIDPDLKGLSAEEIYNRIATDLRRIRKLATLRGTGQCDMLDGTHPTWWERGAGVDLDEFYRRCLSQGLEYHRQRSRGYLPAALVQEIMAQLQPPIPWDVKLARWFDHHFPPIEKRRSYARPSRRQSSTPDIPRPSWVVPWELHQSRTFGVVLDTSGSMSRKLLAKGLGSIASYAMSRDVRGVRLVFCDAAAYDEGYVAPESIAGRVRVRGRGGTVLQPGVDLLRDAEDFPKGAPILIVTDTGCESNLRVTGEHAFLIPSGGRLPFRPRGPVFRMR